jgi:RNA polymerase sigma-70 factor (ECF subfamily)
MQVSSRPRSDPSAILRLVPRQPTPPERPVVDDRTLLAGVQSGDPALASAFCDRVWPQVERTVRRLLGQDDPDRDDLEQLALIELVGTIDRYRGDCSLDTWSQAVASHVVFKHIRRRRIERLIFTDLLLDDGPYPAPTSHGEHPSVTRQLLARVAALLDGMNHERAWAFVLHDVLGYDLREVAQMTKASVSATQSRLVRGRRELHALIAATPELASMIRGVDAGGEVEG